MDAKRTPLQDDVLACARLADSLHQMGKRDLANSIIEAMYHLLSVKNDAVSKVKAVPTVATKRQRRKFQVVVNAESRNSDGLASSILPRACLQENCTRGT